MLNIRCCNFDAFLARGFFTASFTGFFSSLRAVAGCLCFPAATLTLTRSFSMSRLCRLRS